MEFVVSVQLVWDRGILVLVIVEGLLTYCPCVIFGIETKIG